MGTAAPRIDRITWGRIELDDGRSFKDAKLYPGGAREWDWSETGTHHSPGIQPADVQELIDHGAELIVLSQGYYSRLQVCQQTLDLLAERGIEVKIAPTDDAVSLYNESRQEAPTGALIHSTC